MSEDRISFLGGDVNFYRYVENNPTNFFDPYGFGKFCKRAIDGFDRSLENPVTDYLNLEGIHEQYFYGDNIDDKNLTDDNIGFFPSGRHDGLGSWQSDIAKSHQYSCSQKTYDDDKMRSVVEILKKRKMKWNWAHNCQGGADDMRYEYQLMINKH